VSILIALALRPTANTHCTCQLLAPCSSDGNQYFFNSSTNESAWEHPLDDYFRNLYTQRKTMRSDGEPTESGQDRFPAFVTFPVADPDDQMAALHDPVGPRQRVKQWVGAQGGANGGGLAGRKLQRYATSASDTVLGKPSGAFSSGPDTTVGTQSNTSSELAPTSWSHSKRKGKRGSWQAGESGEAAAAQALAWQLEAMELSGQQKSTTSVCPQLAGEAHSGANAASDAIDMPSDAIDMPSGGKAAAVSSTNSSPTLTLSEVFSFPGAAVMQQPHMQRRKKNLSETRARSVDGTLSFSKSWTAPSKAISRAEKREAEHAKQVRRDKLTAMLGLATADFGSVARVAPAGEPTGVSNVGVARANGVTAIEAKLSGPGGDDDDSIT
jgi:hypothetical protein